MRETSIRRVCPQRVLPVLTVNDASVAAPLRSALQQGGLHCAEVTLRSAAALEALALMARDPQFLVGAGTVLTAAQVRAAVAAGAAFVVSPGFSAEVADECEASGVPYFPGVATPTDIMSALARGFTDLKFFPAEALGGVSTLKALSAPFGGAVFIPTGGLTEENCGAYLAMDAVGAVGGSWIATAPLLEQGAFDEIARRAARAVDIAGSSRTPSTVGA